jgi:hypothetical protein
VRIDHRQPPLTPDQIVAYALIGLTLVVLAFSLYGARDDSARMIRAATPVHIVHEDQFQSSPM